MKPPGRQGVLAGLLGCVLMIATSANAQTVADTVTELLHIPKGEAVVPNAITCTALTAMYQGAASLGNSSLTRSMSMGDGIWAEGEIRKSQIGSYVVEECRVPTDFARDECGKAIYHLCGYLPNNPGWR